MVDINPINPQSITVNVPSNGSLIVNNPGRNTAQVSTNADAQLAYSWACGVGLIQGIDYSAKYWAQIAEQAASRELDMVHGSGTIDVEKNSDSIIVSTKNYVHTQATASNAWEINHNLGKVPSVVIEDSEGKRFYPPVEDVDENTCIVHLLGATTGIAYLN